MAVIQGTPNADTLDGTSGDDTITGLAGDDALRGLDGNDTLTGGTGSDFLDGGNGTDTAIVAGSRASSGLQLNAAGDLVINFGFDFDTIRNIESVQFSDQTVAF